MKLYITLVSPEQCSCYNNATSTPQVRASPINRVVEKGQLDGKDVSILPTTSPEIQVGVGLCSAYMMIILRGDYAFLSLPTRQ